MRTRRMGVNPSTVVKLLQQLIHCSSFIWGRAFWCSTERVHWLVFLSIYIMAVDVSLSSNVLWITTLICPFSWNWTTYKCIQVTRRIDKYVFNLAKLSGGNFPVTPTTMHIRDCGSSRTNLCPRHYISSEVIYVPYLFTLILFWVYDKYSLWQRMTMVDLRWSQLSM